MVQEIQSPIRVQKDFRKSGDKDNFKRWQLAKQLSKEGFQETIALQKRKVMALKYLEEKQRTNYKQNLHELKNIIREEEKLKLEFIPKGIRKSYAKESHIEFMAKRTLEAQHKKQISDVKEKFTRNFDRVLAKEGVWINKTVERQNRDHISEHYNVQNKDEVYKQFKSKIKRRAGREEEGRGRER